MAPVGRLVALQFLLACVEGLYLDKNPVEEGMQAAEAVHSEGVGEIDFLGRAEPHEIDAWGRSESYNTGAQGSSEANTIGIQGNDHTEATQFTPSLMDHYLFVFDKNGSRKSKKWQEHEDVRGEDVDAWLHCGRARGEKMQLMFEPALVSIQDGLAGNGARTRVVFENYAGDQEMLRGVKAAAAKGRRPLILSVGWLVSKDTLRACSEAGAYLVRYQTEQGHGSIDAAIKLLIELGGKEAWDFSRVNVNYATTSKSAAAVRVRYVPPGYSDDFEFGVDLHSPDRCEDNVGFIGNWRGRPNATRESIEAALGTHLNTSNRVWTSDDLRAWLTKFPMQLNAHQFNPAVKPGVGAVSMEAFRLAPLLANKACVISEPVLAEDEELWRGIVGFADAAHMPAMMKEFQQDLRGCQERSYQTFKSRFDPVKLLMDSGLFSAWQPPSNESDSSIGTDVIRNRTTSLIPSTPPISDISGIELGDVLSPPSPKQ